MIGYEDQPPHSVEAEQALLAACLTCPEVIAEIDWLTPDDFYQRDHQLVFSALINLAAKSVPVDPLTVGDQLAEIDRDGQVDRSYLAELAVSSRGGANAKHYASTIRSRAMRRKMIAIGHQISRIGYEQDSAAEGINEAQDLIMSLSGRASTDGPKSITDVLRKTVSDIDSRFHRKGALVGLSTGFNDLDSVTAGFQPGQMIVVAGRPSMGKTTFAMNIVEHNMMQGKFCLVFNLEMTSTNLVMKSLSSLGEIPYGMLRAGRIGDHGQELTAAASKIKDKQIYIDDNASLTSQQIVSRARKISLKAGRKVDMIVVDYLQLLNDKGDGHERITKISRALKMAAKSLSCPVVVLSQLNRAVDNRHSDKRPLMSDLRESGAIEQDADLIIMLYRDEVYNDKPENPHRGIAEAIIRKNREGECKTVYLASELHFCRFQNLANSQSIPEPMEPKASGDAFAFLDV